MKFSTATIGSEFIIVGPDSKPTLLLWRVNCCLFCLDSVLETEAMVLLEGVYY